MVNSHMVNSPWPEKANNKSCSRGRKRDISQDEAQNRLGGTWHIETFAPGQAADRNFCPGYAADRNFCPRVGSRHKLLPQGRQQTQTFAPGQAEDRNL